MFNSVLFCLLLSVVSSFKLYVEVDTGNSVVLLCESNKNEYFFSFWESSSNEIIGPGNSYDKNRYDYEVLTGKLFVFNITIKQQGDYTCVSRGINDNSIIKISTVHLFVKENLVEISENDEMLHTFRTLILIGSGILFVMTSYLTYLKWKQKRPVEKLMDCNDDVLSDYEEENEMTRSSPETPSTSNATKPLVSTSYEELDEDYKENNS